MNKFYGFEPIEAIPPGGEPHPAELLSEDQSGGPLVFPAARKGIGPFEALISIHSRSILHEEFGREKDTFDRNNKIFLLLEWQ
jgi:hypothetical protein